MTSMTESSSGSESSSSEGTGVPTSTTDPGPGTIEPTGTTEPTPTGTDGESSSSTTTSDDSSTGTTTDPSSSSSSTGTTEAIEPDCADGLQNRDETDIDCGGPSCAPCGLDAMCQVDIDCITSFCDGGVCGAPGCLVDADCDLLDGPCLDAVCDAVSKSCELAPINEGLACDDDDLCTTGQTCTDGSCLGGSVIDCSALDNSCGVGVCDPDSGACVGDALPGSEGDACDDGFVCTPNDTCQAGLCGVGGPGYLFFEDFNAPDPGWQLGPLWQFGPAVASPNALSGADPGEDHSPGADNGLAGTLIGELVPEVVQAKTCLTSPTIDAAGHDQLWLSYWRHLHTDHFPFAIHTIEAFDGVEWNTVETGFANPGVNDADWTFQQHDISEFADAALRVRICYQRDDMAFIHAGWSLDDLTVGPFVCTPEP